MKTKTTIPTLEEATVKLVYNRTQNEVKEIECVIKDIMPLSECDSFIRCIANEKEFFINTSIVVSIEVITPAYAEYEHVNGNEVA